MFCRLIPLECVKDDVYEIERLPNQDVGDASGAVKFDKSEDMRAQPLEQKLQRKKKET